MLILNRNQGESLILREGEAEITVSLLKVHDNQLNFAISSPDEERILQQELMQETE